MHKITKTYTDYLGKERTEDFYFNLSEAEMIEMELGTTGGYVELCQKVIDANDAASLIKIFKDLVLKAYGEISEDGREFNKSEQISRRFSQTPVYSDIFMELAFDDEASAKFMKGIVPSKLLEKIEEAELKKKFNPSALPINE